MTVVVYPNSAVLAKATAARLLLTLADIQARRPVVHVAISGGSVGTQLLAAVPQSELADLVDWSGIHFWWVDERFVPAGDADRNDAATDEVLFQPLALPEQNLHRMSSTDDVELLELGVQAYAQELAQHAKSGETMPLFDIVLLGMGPDGHVASLFPGHPVLNAGVESSSGPSVTTVGVEDSPKPPSKRITLTLPAVNHARTVWISAWGEGKAEAVAGAIGSRPIDEIPAAGVKGQQETLWLLDVESASKLSSASSK